MKFSLIRVSILLILVAVVMMQIWWAFIAPRDLSSPKSAQTVEAFHAYDANPSDTTKAAIVEQIRLDVSRNLRHIKMWFGLMLFADAVAVYFLWKHGAKKVAA